MVSAVTCAVERITDGNIWFWLEADRLAPFFRRAGTSVHPRTCQRIWKHQSKIEQYYSSRIRRFWVRTGIQIQHPPGSVLGEKQSRIDEMYLKTFLNNGSYLLDSMWPGTNKAGSCLLGACFKLLLLHGFMLFRIHEKFSWWLLSTLFTTDSFKSATVDDKKFSTNWL